MKIKDLFKNLLLYKDEEAEKEFSLKSPQSRIVEYDTRTNKKEEATEIFNNEKVYNEYEKNLSYIKERFTYPINNDFIIRKIKICDKINSFLIFYDGMVDTDAVDLAIIKPLLELPYISEKVDMKNITQTIVAHSQCTEETDFDVICDRINFGESALFIDGIPNAFVFDVKSWGHRSVEKPEIEQSIYGPKESFCEILRNNSALIRKTVKNENLICEKITVGEKSKTSGVVMYLKDVANNDLIDEVKYRINSISTDYIFAIEEISQFIEEKTFMITTQILETERPDRVSRALSEGRVAVLLSGSPKALILPTNAFELMHSASDAYLRYPFANMTRILRLLAMGITLLLPGFYLAITLFHQELIPTYLAYSISAARENVPFPSTVELLLMNFAFEMIQEAGIRMPSPIGSTLGIVGGLILGQAAVSAKIVSPIMIIIISVTGLGSFATSDYSLGWSFRIMRIIFIILAASFGFYGLAIGVMIYTLILGKKTSFGVPFLSPLFKSARGSIGHSVFVNPIWKNEKRPSFLKTKNNDSEPTISKKWKKQ